LTGTQFSTLNSAGSNDPEGPEKYNNTEVKNGATEKEFLTSKIGLICENNPSVKKNL
jgi:hypothetical protein